MKMEKNVQVLRGWPYDGALDRAEPINTGVTLTNGDWVTKIAGGLVDKTGSTASGLVGVVVSGNGDGGTTNSSLISNKATVLWGNFIAQVKTATAFTVGAALASKNGVLVAAVVGTDPVIGYVMEVISASTLNDASVVVKIN